MAKFHVEAAYRNIPIHPSDHFRFEMRWRDQFYVDLVLPFGLRSTPYLFDAVASAVHWILETNYQVSPLLHYLDDFLTMGPANSHLCQSHVSSAIEIFQRLGLPLHPTKCKGPVATLVFLGIELDSIRQTARHPNEKFERILALLRSWVTCRTCHRQELESLMGHLHHACKVVRMSRAFLRRMIDLRSPTSGIGFTPSVSTPNFGAISNGSLLRIRLVGFYSRSSTSALRSMKFLSPLSRNKPIIGAFRNR